MAQTCLGNGGKIAAHLLAQMQQLNVRVEESVNNVTMTAAETLDVDLQHRSKQQSRIEADMVT